ncbi:MAG: deoxyribonuclease [Candidatus Peribacteria bacterium]|nr:deoxyribonuclease [Candidatus Peribacteria bacterium]
MLHFAVAGSPLSTPKPGGTCEGIKRAHELGITAMEMEWVQQVPKNVERMREIRECAEKHAMYLTVHAPYYINLNSEKPETIEASIKRITDALSMAELAGAHSVCVHAAFNLKMPPETVYANVKNAIERVMEHKKKLFPHVNLGLETMGKHVQFGTLDEVLRISKEFDVYPVIDPAHMHARANGGVNSTAEWNEMLDTYAEYLGKNSLQNMHLHYSGIAYNATGERNHVPLQESDAKWQDFLKVLKDRNIGGTCVCESPLLEDDTVLMRDTFATL